MQIAGSAREVGRMSGLAVGTAVHLTAAYAAAGRKPPSSRTDNDCGRSPSMRGVRPNSVNHTISVESSRPRSGQVVEQGGRSLIQRRQHGVFQTRKVVAKRVQ